MSVILNFLIAVSAILFVVSGAILYGLKNRLENVNGFEAVKTASAALTIWMFFVFSLLSLFISVGIKWGQR